MFTTIYMLTALIIGDSHVAEHSHLGRYLKQNLEQQKYKVNIKGFVGIGSYGLSKKEFNKHNLTIIVLGTNDIPGNGAYRSYVNLSYKYPYAFVVGPPKFKNKSLDSRSRKISDMQHRIFGNRFINSRLCYGIDKRFNDGVHFTDKSALSWSNCILKYIKAENEK